MKTHSLAGAVAGLCLALAGSGTPAAAAGTAGMPGTARTLTVFAAASLKETFTTLKNRFQAGNPDVQVTLNFGGSSELAQDLIEGARADVFAAASDTTMRRVTDAGLTIGPPAVLATNMLEIATAPGNPKHLTSLTDLTRPDLLVVLCQPQVPCGAAAHKIQQSTGVTLHPATEETDVKQALADVTSGNADAALVYTTDIAATSSAQGIPFPEAQQAITHYSITVLGHAREPELAHRFQDLVTSEPGQQTLRSAGFEIKHK